MSNLEKLLHAWDEADNYINQKMNKNEQNVISSIVATSTASAQNNSTVSFNGTGKALEKLIIEGKTVQNGTPTGLVGVDVNGVGDKTVNVFDKKTCIRKDGYYIDTGGVEQKSTGMTGYTVSFTDVRPNTNYMFSGKVTDGNSVRVNFYNAAGDFIGTTAVQTQNNFAFKTPEICYKIRFNYIVSAVDLDSIQIQEGTQITAYEPYGKYKIPVVTGGKTNIVYLDSPLFDGETADLVAGNVNKSWGLAIFDGSSDETWKHKLINSNHVFYIGAGEYLTDNKPKGKIVCNLFNNIITPSAGVTEGIWFDDSGDLNILVQSFESNVTAFKNFISTFKVLIVYELNSEAKKTFENSVFPTSTGETELSVNTEIVPVSIALSTYGDYYTKSEVEKIISESVPTGSIETLTYIGKGGVNRIEFPKNPKLILSISGMGQREYTTTLPFDPNVASRYTVSLGGSSSSFTSMEFTKYNNTITMIGPPDELAMNYKDSLYTVVYIPE